MTPQIIITDTGVFDIVAGIGVPGKSILVGGGTVTGGGGGGGLIDIRALSTINTGVFDSSSNSSYNGFYNYAINNPVTNETQPFKIEYLPSASGVDTSLSGIGIWSTYYNKYVMISEDNNGFPRTSVNGKLYVSGNLSLSNDYWQSGAEIRGIAENPNTGTVVFSTRYYNGEYVNPIIKFSIENNTIQTGSISGATSKQIRKIVYSPELDRFVTVGDTLGSNSYPQKGIMYSDDDGTTWTTGSFGFNWGSFPDISDVVWDASQSLFIGVGNSIRTTSIPVAGHDAVYYSTDGITWYTGSAPGLSNTQGPIFPDYEVQTTLKSITYLDGKYVALGAYRKAPWGGGGYPTFSAALITSSNGINWSSVQFASESWGQSLYTESPFGVTTDTKYIYGIGAGTTLLTSSDATNWGYGTLNIPGSANNFAKIIKSPVLNQYLHFSAFPAFYKVSSDFETFTDLDTDTNAVVLFQTSQSADIYDTNLSWYEADVYYGFVTSSNSYRWVQFELYDDDTVPQYTQTYGTASYGIEISSASISDLIYNSISGFEDVEIGGKRYIQELDDPTSTSRYAYYELEPYYELPYNFTQSYSFTIKSSGRRYVYFSYGYYGDQMNGYDMIGMKIDTVSGSITYYEDGETNTGNVFGTYSTDTGLKFVTPPSIVSSGSGYWTVSFNVNMRNVTYGTSLPGTLSFQSGSF